MARKKVKQREPYRKSGKKKSKGGKHGKEKESLDDTFRED